jgi:predicted nucleotidyltransferase component of viral defense system
LKSGSKKEATTPALPELTSWQLRVLDAVARSSLANDATFGGATALAAVYLHHRRSADLDFFLLREVEPTDVQSLAASLKRAFQLDARTVGPRTMLTLSSKGREVGHVDLAFYPYDPVGRPTRWRGLRVDAIEDIAVNKVQAVLTRARERDFVDLYFLLREGPERDVEKLLSLVRAKFDAGPSRVTLAESLLRVEEVRELPEMIRPLTLEELNEFFVSLARRLVAKGPR